MRGRPVRELPIQHRLGVVIFRTGKDDIKSGIAPEQRERKMSRWAVYLGASHAVTPNPRLCCHIHPPSQHTLLVRNNSFGLVRWCSGERVSGLTTQVQFLRPTSGKREPTPGSLSSDRHMHSTTPTYTHSKKKSIAFPINKENP